MSDSKIKITMKNYLRYIACGFIGLSLASCEDFLDVTSENQTLLDDFYNTADECRAESANLYNRPWYPFNSAFYLRIGDSRSNNMYSDRITTPEAIHNRLVDNSSTGGIEEGWDSFYSVIGQADILLNTIDDALSKGVSETAVNACKGEARFMRGLAYWYLANAWYDVPIIEDPEALALNYMVPPNYQEDVLQYAIKDMEYAAEWLPTSDDAGRVTRYSALGMLSRFYITAACYARGGKFTTSRYPTTAEEYYQKAKEAAYRVCKESPNRLMSDYEQLFRVQNNNNSESLFALQWVGESSTYGVGNAIQANMNNYAQIMDGDKSWGGSNTMSGELVELMINRGELSRKRAAMFYSGAVYDYITVAATGENFVVPSAKLCFVKKHVVGNSNDTGIQSVSQNSGLATPMLRLAEVYLLYAEAELGLNEVTNDPTALYYFNQVRNRAGLESLEQITLDDIWNERRCELAIEGQFWYDMVRRSYWDMDWVINFMKNQKRAYRYNYSAPPTFSWMDSDGRDIKTPDASVMRLVYPLSEETLNPLLNATPEHFDVK
jgi:hypothetical protein